MRVVGYVRESLDPREGEPAFAQTERIRRWAADGGHLVVAVCQDLRSADDSARWDGLRAVIGILQGGAATAVVVPNLATFSSDKVVQEIILRDLRSRGAAVVSANEADHVDLDPASPDRLRMIVRDVLARVDEHQARFADQSGDGPVETPDHVVVELVPPEAPGPRERIRPVR